MACTHSANCPLHPYLRGTLEAWRTNYCDTAGEFVTCARFQQSTAGNPVPLALLPNGKMVQALDPSHQNLTSGSTPDVSSKAPEVPSQAGPLLVTTMATDTELHGQEDNGLDGLQETVSHSSAPGLWRRIKGLFGASK